MPMIPDSRLSSLWLAALAVSVGLSGCSRSESPKDQPAAAPATTVATAPTPEPSATPDDGPVMVGPEEFQRMAKPFTGDLPEMVKRRVVRVLVTYSATLYFVDLGRQGGATYEAGQLLEQELGRRFGTGALRVRVVFIPVARDRLLPALREGYGDIAASNLTVTPARLKSVAFADPTATGVDEVVVTGPGAPEIRAVEDLSGRDVYVRASSSFAESLEALNASFRKAGRRPARVVPVDERLETEDILEMTNAGLYPVTIVDTHMARLWAQVFRELRVHEGVAVKKGTSVAWALRKDNPKLKQLVDAFMKKNREGTLAGNVIINRYLKNADWIKSPANERDMERFRSMVGLFRQYGKQYRFDWMLVTAQAYQESGLDQSKRSRAGAVGVMQVLPSTARGRDVNIPNIELLEHNIHAGVKYLRFIADQYFDEPGMSDVDRHLFAFASYNAGPARVSGLRLKAKRVGLDPNRWFGNVEIVAAREIGRETVQYVSNIFKYYLAYKLVAGLQQERREAKQAAGP
jgi:membrane-bound lytic murein transglycosylase MltF